MQYENIPEILNTSISSLINNLLVSVDSHIFSVLDELVFIDNSVLSDKYFINFFSKSYSMVTFAKALLFGILIYYAISYLFSFLSCNNFQKPAHFLLKFFFSAILIHFSSSICGAIISFFDLLTQIFRDIGVSLFSFHLSFSFIYQKFSSLFFNDLNTSFQLFSFDGIVKSLVSLAFVNLLFTYSVRFIFIKMLLLASPFAFLSIALDQSKWIFKIWIKNFIGQLCVQLLICVIILIIFSFNNEFNPTITKLLYLGSIMCLIKASSFVKDFTSGFTSDVTTSLNNIKSNLL